MPLASWENIGYALLCLLLPVGWGLAVVWASNWIERRLLGTRRSRHGSRRRPVRPIEYHI